MLRYACERRPTGVPTSQPGLPADGCCTLRIEPSIKGHPHLHLPTRAVMEEHQGQRVRRGAAAAVPAKARRRRRRHLLPLARVLPLARGAPPSWSVAAAALQSRRESRPWARQRGRTRSARACRAGRRASWTSRCCTQASKLIGSLQGHPSQALLHERRRRGGCRRLPCSLQSHP